MARQTCKLLQTCVRIGTIAEVAMLQVLAEEILPALERLRKEKGNYMQYQAAEATLDRLKRFVHGYHYVSALKHALPFPGHIWLAMDSLNMLLRAGFAGLAEVGIAVSLQFCMSADWHPLP